MPAAPGRGLTGFGAVWRPRERPGATPKTAQPPRQPARQRCLPAASSHAKARRAPRARSRRLSSPGATPNNALARRQRPLSHPASLRAKARLLAEPARTPKHAGFPPGADASDASCPASLHAKARPSAEPARAPKHAGSRAARIRWRFIRLIGTSVGRLSRLSSIYSRT